MWPLHLHIERVGTYMTRAACRLYTVAAIGRNPVFAQYLEGQWFPPSGLLFDASPNTIILDLHLVCWEYVWS